ncbi:MAG: LptF/LptG family permease [Bacteriovoracaceae bacterium]|nr:LptF/LptG family permease [Bacteriovoracaceae bacterium]
MRLLLQRYMAANFVLPLMVSLVFFVTFMLTFELFRLTSLLMTRDITVPFMAGLLGNLALTFIPLALPLATFFSVVFCLNKLSTDSEYIAMRAAGFTKGKIFVPFFIVSVLLASSVYFLNQQIIPYTNRDFKRQVNFLTSSGLLASIQAGQFFTAIPNITLFPTTVSTDGRDLGDVFLQLKDSKGERVIMAKKGVLDYQRNSKTLVESLTLNLYDGNIVALKSGFDDSEKILFKSYTLPISQNKFSDRISPRETMLNGRELAAVLKMTNKQAEEKYRFDERDMFNAKYEHWNRMNTPLLCLLLTFLGFGLGVKENRGKGRNSALYGLGSLILFYGLFFFLIGIARKGGLPVPVAMLIPDSVLLFLGIYFFRKLDWQG